MTPSFLSTCISPAILTVILLVISNVFMTFAWYGHLKLSKAGISTNWPLIVVILFSWGIALLEYLCQVPANRMGFEGNGGPYSLMQLKVMQEVITLVVFVIFSAMAFEGFELRWNHYLAGLLLIGAVYLVFMK
ncbi:MAG: DMT family protein [Bacteroidales bacterium]|nr:DMT family protein [Bacteroidales bacterium]